MEFDYSSMSPNRYRMEAQVMKCEDCGTALEVDTQAVRRYELGGIPHVELHGIEVARCPKCGLETLGFPRMIELHDVIAQGFVTQTRALASSEIRFLRKYIELSSTDFAQRMGVSRETVSRWESGAQQMGPVADRLLRLLVITHAPSEDCNASDVLRALTNEAPPKRLPSRAVVYSRAHGWQAQRPSRAVSA